MKLKTMIGIRGVNNPMNEIGKAHKSIRFMLDAFMCILNIKV